MLKYAAFMKKILSFAGMTFLIATSSVWARAKADLTTRAGVVPSQDSLTLAFPGVKGPIPYEKYVDEQFARNARPALIPL